MIPPGKIRLFHLTGSVIIVNLKMNLNPPLIKWETSPLRGKPESTLRVIPKCSNWESRKILLDPRQLSSGMTLCSLPFLKGSLSWAMSNELGWIIFLLLEIHPFLAPTTVRSELVEDKDRSLQKRDL